MNERDAELRGAAYNNRLNRTKALLKLGANPNATDEDGQTALHSAVAWFQPFMSDMISRWYTKPEVLEALIEGGARLDIQDNEGVTPLSLACRNGNEACAQFLLERGADPNQRDHHGWSALTWHLWKNMYLGKFALRERFLTKKTVQTLWDALLVFDNRLAERLVEGAPLTPLGPYQLTLLHLAARADSVRVTERLLARGADVRALDSDHATPLHFAMGGHSWISNSGMGGWKRWGPQKDRERLATLLLKAGARVDVQASWYGYDPEFPEGETPLEWAIGLKSVGLVRVLLRGGADPNQKNQYGEPVLMDAIDTKNADVVKVLLEAVANPEVRDTVWSAWKAAEKLPRVRRLLQEAIKKKNTPSPVIGRGG